VHVPPSGLCSERADGAVFVEGPGLLEAEYCGRGVHCDDESWARQFEAAACLDVRELGEQSRT
jgi:hypothetical protein